MNNIVVVFSIFSIIAPASASAACSKGKITCLAWCQKYGGDTCMTGHWNSCDRKLKGPATCVPDRPRSR